MALVEYTTADAIKARLDIDDTDEVDAQLLDALASEANDWLESTIGFPVGPIGPETRYFDGSEVIAGVLPVYPYGIRSISALRYATSTGGSYTDVTSSDFSTWLRPTRGPTGWPYFEIVVAETTYIASWPTDGYRLIAVTGDWGWAAVPPELAGIATRKAIGLYQSRGYGSGATYAVGDDGTALPMENLSGSDWRSIYRYKSLDAVGP